MAKIFRPLFGDSAVGSVAKTITFSKWKEWATAKFPHYKKDRRTGAQDERRKTFQFGVQLWHDLTDLQRHVWKLASPAGQYGFSFFIGLYLHTEEKPEIPPAVYGTIKYSQNIYGVS